MNISITQHFNGGASAKGHLAAQKFTQQRQNTTKDTMQNDTCCGGPNATLHACAASAANTEEGLLHSVIRHKTESDRI